MYKAMEPPRIGLDCDTYELIAPPFEEYKKERTKDIDKPHNSVYHQETIQEHIDMTIEQAKKYTNIPELIEIATWHDLGKAICRQPKEGNGLGSKFVRERYGSHDRYLRHERVSAMYHFISKNQGDSYDSDINDAILYHMIAHDGISNKFANHMQISDRSLDLAHTFAHIVDEVSKVRDEQEVEYFKKLNKVEGILKEANNSEDISISANFEKDLFTLKYVNGGVDFSNKLTRNSRGLTLNSENKVVTIGFEKFFNYKQLESYESYSEQFKRERADTAEGEMIVYEKLDGTFITLGTHNNEFIAATSSSTRLDFSKNAQTYFSQLSNQRELKDYLEDNNLCLLFEYTAPDNRIVVLYEKTEYTLIGARKRDLDSRLETRAELENIAQRFNLKIAKKSEMTLKEILEYQETNRDSEGFVVVNEYGNLIKFKTNYWFEEKARIADIFFGRWDTQAKRKMFSELYINDEFDDLIARRNQSNPGELKVLDEIQKRADLEIKNANKLYKETKNLEPREIAQTFEKFEANIIFAIRKVEDNDIKTALKENEMFRNSFFNKIYDEILEEEKLKEK